MISKSFVLQEVKKAKGSITVDFKEIQEVSAFIKEETKNLLNDILESKVVGVAEIDVNDVESQKGGSNE